MFSLRSAKVAVTVPPERATTQGPGGGQEGPRRWMSMAANGIARRGKGAAQVAPVDARRSLLRANTSDQKELTQRRKSRFAGKSLNDEDDTNKSKCRKLFEKRPAYVQRVEKRIHAWAQERRHNELDSRLESLEKYRSKLHYVVCVAVESPAFSFAIITTIVINMITIALETLESFQNRTAERIFAGLSLAYLTIYTIEFFFKIFAEPFKYWKNNYNRMDFFVLAISYLTDVVWRGDNVADVSFLKLFRALRALRALRSISFIRPLQVLVSALLKTMGSIFYLVALLMLLMFVWAMIGHYAFGRGPGADYDEWGSIEYAMYQLWVLVTLDSWTDLQERLVERGFDLSTVSMYIVPWIFVGNFIFTNLFIGVVVQNLEEAQNEEKQIREQKRNEMFDKKKKFIIEKQKRDLEQLMKTQEKNGNVSLDDYLKTLAGTLNHTDVAPVKTLCCSRLWFETYMETAQYYENSRRRVLQLHNDISRKLHELLERRMEATLRADAYHDFN